MEMVVNNNVLYSENLVVVVLDFFKGMGGLNYRICFVLNIYVKFRLLATVICFL